MISRRTANATLVALLATASLAAAASVRGFATDPAPAAAHDVARPAGQVRIVELPRVTIVAKRLSANAD